MPSILDAPIPTKIVKMRQRVQWNHPEIRSRNIDQTSLFLDDSHQHKPAFSFLVIGDSGYGPHTRYHPQRQVAEQMLPHLNDCCFLLHTGDVVYTVGSHEQYPQNFIQPYREWLKEDREHRTSCPISYDNMVFNRPFLPVLGNHDYYNLPKFYSTFAKLTLPAKRLLKRMIFNDVNPSNLGTCGSNMGDAYAKAFLDYLQRFTAEKDLVQHLDQHYTAESDWGKCLRYQPGQFTRLPNRYYTFRYGGIDFFALDSSTFNRPSSLSKELAPIDKPYGVDIEQLQWLKKRLIDSWMNPQVRGRIIYLHHPPYVTEATKWNNLDTLAVRQHLRWVLDGVAEALEKMEGDRTTDQPLVNLILSGHAHCFEYLQTGDTGHADSHLTWIVCGGSGARPRHQRENLGDEIEETVHLSSGVHRRIVAKSKLYVGHSGHGAERKQSYSFLRVDIQSGTPPTLILRPHVSERYQDAWTDVSLAPLTINF
ncbi:MAG: metallophosphoesterase [Cyanobacteria bacterium P01_F01_bin.150]